MGGPCRDQQELVSSNASRNSRRHVETRWWGPSDMAQVEDARIATHFGTLSFQLCNSGLQCVTLIWIRYVRKTSASLLMAMPMWTCAKKMCCRPKASTRTWQSKASERERLAANAFRQMSNRISSAMELKEVVPLRIHF